jgi:tRNA(Ile2)-agmatinylcytidine synthase
MAAIGLDDTDSRDRGMCTTYLAARIATRLRERGYGVSRPVLVRLNPAIEAKTRGNAALAIHVDRPNRADRPDQADANADADIKVDEALSVAREAIDAAAETADPNTDPGLVVAPGSNVPPAVAAFSSRAVTDRLTIAAARAACETTGFRYHEWGNGRGLIGALAAVGARRAFSEWTVEHIAYREPERWGTPRSVDARSVFAAADRGYPEVWDTVDRGEREVVCVPRTPCPVLFGVRGENPAAVERVAAGIESEPIACAETFLTNQGTDTHLREGTIATAEEGRSYRLSGVVASAPETRRGGHVFFDLGSGGSDGGGGGGNDGDDTGSSERVDERTEGSRLRCVAFEPTKRFRDRVRALRVGDRLVVCGEVSEETLKLEKFAVRDLVRTERVVPTCPDCGTSMESAGRDQGYRCRDCGTDRDGKVFRWIERDLDVGWHEVPPRARRHVAKPLIRGGFDAPTFPER